MARQNLHPAALAGKIFIPFTIRPPAKGKGKPGSISRALVFILISLLYLVGHNSCDIYLPFVMCDLGNSGLDKILGAKLQ
jgi:hypothetical protein